MGHTYRVEVKLDRRAWDVHWHQGKLLGVKQDGRTTERMNLDSLHGGGWRFVVRMTIETEADFVTAMDETKLGKRAMRIFKSDIETSEVSEVRERVWVLRVSACGPACACACGLVCVSACCPVLWVLACVCVRTCTCAHVCVCAAHPCVRACARAYARTRICPPPASSPSIPSPLSLPSLPPPTHPPALLSGDEFRGVSTVRLRLHLPS